MKGKMIKWMRKHALIAGLGLGYGASTLEASIPYFEGWKDRRKIDSRIAIGSNVAKVEKLEELVKSYIAGKSYNPNQKVFLGDYLPIIHYAACLKEVTALERLLEDNNTVVAVETSLGNTPMHAAAINSVECLKVLIKDGRLDLNEHNYDGKTPLYVAMEHNVNDSHKGHISALLGDSRIKVNSRDNKGRTMLHIAVLNGDVNVVGQLLNTEIIKAANADTSHHEINATIQDDKGKTAYSYIDNIKDPDVKSSIQGIFTSRGISS